MKKIIYALLAILFLSILFFGIASAAPGGNDATFNPITGKQLFKDTAQFKNGITIPSGAGAGKVLTSDAYGKASWETGSGGGGGGATGPSGVTGATGPTGSAGSNGSNGGNGAAGATGATGPTGSAGSNGSNGTNGSDGATGATGAAGSNGSNGSNGAAGATGATGATGSAGSNGSNGSNGSAGATGATGPTGSAGSNGSNGSNGSAGATGATGATGSAGSNGSNGSNGSAGATGATGPTGSAGSNGSNGSAGAPGATGPSGTKFNAKSATDGSITGTTSETLITSFLIPANTLTTGDAFLLISRVRKTGTSGSLTLKVRIHTSSAVAGNIIYSANTVNASSASGQMYRWALIKSSSNTEVMPTSVIDDIAASQTAVSTFNIDWTVDQYVIFTITLGSSGDTGYLSGYVARGY